MAGCDTSVEFNRSSGRSRTSGKSYLKYPPRRQTSFSPLGSVAQLFRQPVTLLDEEEEAFFADAETRTPRLSSGSPLETHRLLFWRNNMCVCV